MVIGIASCLMGIFYSAYELSLTPRDRLRIKVEKLEQVQRDKDEMIYLQKRLEELESHK